MLNKRQVLLLLSIGIGIMAHLFSGIVALQTLNVTIAHSWQLFVATVLIALLIAKTWVTSRITRPIDYIKKLLLIIFIAHIAIGPLHTAYSIYSKYTLYALLIVYVFWGIVDAEELGIWTLMRKSSIWIKSALGIYIVYLLFKIQHLEGSILLFGMSLIALQVFIAQKSYFKKSIGT